MAGGDRARGLVVGLGEKTIPRLDGSEPLASSHFPIAVRHRACDDDLLQVAERPRTWGVQRPKAAEPTRKITLVRVAPSESDSLAPERIARGAEPPPRREHSGEIVRVVIVPRGLPSRAGHCIRESPFDREMFERRGADLPGPRMPERTEDVPEQHVAREVIRLPQGVVRRRLGRRHEAEGRPAPQQPVQRRTARVAVTLTHDVVTGQSSVVRDEQQRVKLLVELERDVLGLTRSERGAGPRAVGPLRDVEKPGYKTVHRRASARVPGSR